MAPTLAGLRCEFGTCRLGNALRFIERLRKTRVKLYISDEYTVYANLIPAGQLSMYLNRTLSFAVSTAPANPFRYEGAQARGSLHRKQAPSRPCNRANWSIHGVTSMKGSFLTVALGDRIDNQSVCGAGGSRNFNPFMANLNAVLGNQTNR